MTRNYNKSVTRFLLLATLCLLATIRVDRAQADEWSELKASLPETVNSILVIDAQRMFASKMSEKHGWQKEHEEAFELNPTLMPPTAEKFILGSELNLDHLESGRQYAVISLARPKTIGEVRDRMGGRLERFGDLEALQTARGNFIIRRQPDRFIVARHAQRQWVAKQFRSSAAAVLPPVLNEAIEQVRDGCSIAMAMDLQGAIPESAFPSIVRKSKLASKSAEQFTKELEGVEGFVFTINIDDEIRGQLDIIFHTDVEMLKKHELGKPLLLQILAGAGASLPDFREWEEQCLPNRCRLQGEMTVAGLSRVLSILNVDASDIASLGQESYRNDARESKKRFDATRRYVSFVAKLVDDIADGAEANSLMEQLLWTDRAAKKILSYRTRDVDPDVVELGQSVAFDLIEIVTTFQNGKDSADRRSQLANPPPIQWRVQIVPYRTFVTPYGRFYRYRPLGYADVNIHQNAERHRKHLAQEMEKANEKSKLIFQRIEATVGKLNKSLDSLEQL